MLDKKSIALIGYSGHAYVVFEATILMDWGFSGYCEKRQAINNPYNLDYLGFEGDKNFDWNIAGKYVLGIGDNKLRYKIGELVKFKNKELLNVIHPTAVVSTSVKLQQGVFIGANVVVNALATIEDFTILNSGCLVEHECAIGKATHIAPGAVLAGNVNIGQRSFIGANSVIKQGVNIGENVIIGAGSTVLKDIPDNQIWAGNPAKLLKK